MAKRRTFSATVVDAAGETVATATAYAWNSAVRASESLVRELARERGAMYAGSLPVVEGRPGDGTYRRMWAGEDGLTVWAVVSS